MTENVNTGITLFTNEEFGNVRVIMRDGEPWFVAKDVCDCLDTRTDNIRAILEEDEVLTINPYTIGVAAGGRDMLIVSEAGLYSLILRSRKPDAKKFKRWVTHEVLPAIRKTGSYSVLPTTYLDALKALVAAEEEKQRLAQENAEALQTITDQQCLIDDQANKLGIGKNYKAVTAFPWLREYFAKTDTQACSRIGRAISALCRMRGYAITRVEDSHWNTVGGYHVDAIEEFRQLLDEHPEMLVDIRKK